MASRRPRPVVASTGSSSVRQFLSKQQEQKGEEQRLRTLHACRRGLFAAAKALSDCGHRIPRLPQPSPDRLSPGDDVGAWVRGHLVSAVGELRSLEARLALSVVPLLRTSVPITRTPPMRRPYLQVMEDVFIALLKAKAKPRAVDAAVRSLEAVARECDGEVGVFAQWFEYAVNNLGARLEAIPLDAFADEAELRQAARVAFEIEVVATGRRKRPGPKRKRDLIAGKKLHDAMATRDFARVIDAIERHGLNPRTAPLDREAYRKRMERQRPPGETRPASAGIPRPRDRASDKAVNRISGRR